MPHVTETAYANERVEHGLLLLPEHMRDGTRRYIMRGIEGGSFLTAIFANDFIGAVNRADNENQLALLRWADFIYNYAPSGCHGSYELVESWCAIGGLEGREKVDE